MHDFTDNQLLDFELAYKHNPDVLQLIEEIRELRLIAAEADEPLDEPDACCCADCGKDLTTVSEAYCYGCSGLDD